MVPGRPTTVTIAKKAMELVVKSYPNVLLNIFGSFPNNDYSSWVRSLPEKYGINKNICFRGYKTALQLVSEYEKASMYIIPSRMENSSNSLAEAQLFGLPVIASDAGGSPYLVDNGKNGLLFLSENQCDLADKINLLIRSNNLAHTLSKEGRNTALKRHNKESIVIMRMNIYDSELALSQKK